MIWKLTLLPRRIARDCGCCVMTIGPESVAAGGVTVRCRSGCVAVAEYFPACKVCTFEITNTLLVSSGNRIPSRHHWICSGGVNVVTKVKDTVAPAGTVWAAGEMEAPGSVRVRDCFTATSL